MGAVPPLCGHGDRSLKGLGGGRCLRALQGNPQAHAAETFSFSLWGVGEHVTSLLGPESMGVSPGTTWPCTRKAIVVDVDMTKSVVASVRSHGLVHDSTAMP